MQSYDEISWFGSGQAPQGATFAYQSPLPNSGAWTLDYAAVQQQQIRNNPLGLAHEFLADANYRNNYLRYFWQQVRRLDDQGWFLAPGRRGVELTPDDGSGNHAQGIGYLYRAYDPTPALLALNLPGGHDGQQATIRGLFTG